MSATELIKADIVVIGAGSGGLSVAAGAAMLGLGVVLFEKARMGGDCLNFGCVPSKALITSARQAQSMREAGRLGIAAVQPDVDWLSVRKHVESAIAAIEPNDSVERFESLGVRVILEAARFADTETIISENYRVKARRIVIATGSRASTPLIPGLETVPFLTNETIFSVDELPKRLLILGGGPIGVELGQAFQRLGSDITLIDRSAILPRAEPAHADIVRQKLIAEGVTLFEDADVLAVSGEAGAIELKASRSDGTQLVLNGTHLLVAAGRTPVLDQLDLEAGNVDHTPKGIETKANLRSTSNSRVWIVGDAAGRGQFTHLAGWHASVFVRNALFKSRSKADGLPLPAVTYCEPEMAQIGLSEHQARIQHGDDVSVSTFSFDENDRAIAEADTVGEVKLVLRKGAVIGASVLGAGAGDIIQMLALAMSNGLKAKALTNFISPYPTRTEAVKRAASAHFQPLVFGKWAKRLVALLQRIP